MFDDSISSCLWHILLWFSQGQLEQSTQLTCMSNVTDQLNLFIVSSVWLCKWFCLCLYLFKMSLLCIFWQRTNGIKWSHCGMERAPNSISTHFESVSHRFFFYQHKSSSLCVHFIIQALLGYSMLLQYSWNMYAIKAKTILIFIIFILFLFFSSRYRFVYKCISSNYGNLRIYFLTITFGMYKFFIRKCKYPW